MLDAFIIDQIEKKEEAERKREPYPLSVPLEIEETEQVKKDDSKRKVIFHL